MTTVRVEWAGGPDIDPGHAMLPFPRVPGPGEWIILPSGRLAFVEQVTWDFTNDTRGVLPVLRVAVGRPRS